MGGGGLARIGVGGGGTTAGDGNDEDIRMNLH